MTRLKDGPGEENNPIVQYQEWTEHRYDSGHWLGGNVPPAARGLWSIPANQKRWLGLTYLLIGMFGLYRVFSVKTADPFAVFSMVFWLVLICLVPGAAMYFGNRVKHRRKRQTDSRPPEDMAPPAKHHGHGRFSDHRHDS